MALKPNRVQALSAVNAKKYHHHLAKSDILSKIVTGRHDRKQCPEP
jgi:hypothetical protein